MTALIVENTFEFTHDKNVQNVLTGFCYSQNQKNDDDDDDNNDIKDSQLEVTLLCYPTLNISL